MATCSGNTSSRPDQKNRRKKTRNQPKSETDTIGESHIECGGKWKVADVDYSALKLDELREFMGIEELSAEREIVTSTPSTRARKRARRRKTSRMQQMRKKQEETSKEPREPPPKMQKTTHQKTSASQNRSKSAERTRKEASDEPEEKDAKVAMETNLKDADAEDGRRQQIEKAASFTKGIPVPNKDSNVNLPAWKKLSVPAPILRALHDLGYNEPTPIQKACIPPAIKNGKDIVGAAETGSGKTLAFGIPIIHNILQHRAALQRQARTKAFKQANAVDIGTKQPVATHLKKEQVTVKSSRGKNSGVQSLGFEKMGLKSELGDEAKKGRKGGKRSQEEDIRDVAEEKDNEEMGDDDSDEDIEYAFDEEDSDDDDIGDDEAEDVEFDDIDDGDSGEDEEVAKDEDLDDFIEANELRDGLGEFTEANGEDSSEGDGDDEEDERTGTKRNDAFVDKDAPADKPPKRPRGKKGARKRRFRTQERKTVELGGEEYEGVELINKMDKHGFGCVRAIDDISDAELLTRVGLGEAVEQLVDAGHGCRDDGELYAMVLTPTRELAVQVKNHLVAVAKHTDVKIAVIVGGMSAQKQERLLKKRPEIVVGTPGRIWELFREGEPHLSTMSGIRCLVLDEADRMVEKGHYEQLTEILRLMNHSPASLQRQTFVFSATLTLVHLGSDRKILANRAKQKTPQQEKKDRKEKLGALMRKVGIRDGPTVVDLTQKQGTVASLMEAKIICDVADKDIYLYYFLLQFPGRTLVFCNSIDCIRRLCSILTLLACNPLPLHSSMHQKQRLKNLDRFASNPKALLLATDVAARGLDIPDVQHVIHYQVPRTSEMYIHRSGRTARQAKEGVSVMIVSSSEAYFYKRVCKTLKRDDIPSFPVDHMYFGAVKERVDSARVIDQASHRMEKKKHANEWFIKAAKDLDINLDEDLVLHDLGDAVEQGQHERKLQHLKGELKLLLKRSIFPRGSSWLYPMAAGKLVTPLTQGSSNALHIVKQVGKKKQNDAQVLTEPAKKVKKSKNKFKRAEAETA